MIDNQLISSVKDVQNTPYYMFNLDAISEMCFSMIKAWSSQFPDFVLAYSYKTNSISAITKILRKSGAAAEVVSGDELELALDDGYTPSEIYFDGPYKTRTELHRAMSLGVRIQIDSIDEARIISSLAKEEGFKATVSVRVAGLREDKESSRFGLTTSEVETVRSILRSAHIKISGIHFNTGFHDTSPGIFVEHIHHYGDLITRGVRDHSLSDSRFIVDIGGGFPASANVPKGSMVPHPLSFAAALGEAIDILGINRSDIRLVIEPGRSLVEDHGILVARVVALKERLGTRLAVIDAGTNLVRSINLWPHDIRFLRHGSTPYDLLGSMCFENDRFGSSVLGPHNLVIGDFVIVGNAGGYDIPSSNVWLRPSPPVYGFSEKNGIYCIREKGRSIR